jgi:hypothetical protein
MNFKKLILQVLNEAETETPVREPKVKPTEKPSPGKPGIARPGPGHKPAPDAKKDAEKTRKEKQIEAFKKRHNIK